MLITWQRVVAAHLLPILKDEIKAYEEGTPVLRHMEVSTKVLCGSSLSIVFIASTS